MRVLYYIFCLLLVSAVLVSCQKEENIKDTQLNEINPNLLAKISIPGTYLASSGILTVTIKDSTYVFDAQKDSIAYVNLYLDNKTYFGITAINKEHTLSFGISSPGFAQANQRKDIAGSQFILSKGNRPNIQYALTPAANLQRISTISFNRYAQDTTMAKGNFTTYLASGIKSDSSFYRVKGEFDLKLSGKIK